MDELPQDIATFLFTDVESSTVLWERDSEKMRAALARHDYILREAVGDHGGHIFKVVGDAFHAAFTSASDALHYALAAQLALQDERWDDGCHLKVRMALHTGQAQRRGDDYLGPSLNRVSRLLNAGYGGQILLSGATREMVRDQLPVETSLRTLRERRLKDLSHPEKIFQLVAPDLPSEFPPLKTLDARRNNLPAQPTAFVGREREVTVARESLRAENTRLLTLTGPGGTGKTRLGLRVAAGLVDEFEEGVCFVALAAVSDTVLVATAIAHALGVVETVEQTPLERLKEYLSHREILLVLDNFEQVLDAAIQVSELLRAAPRLKVLVTSREELRLYGEHVLPVPPLPTPSLDEPQEVGKLAMCESVDLFVSRARAVRFDFAFTTANAPAIAETCVRLEGLPLAIELAAARIRSLPPRAILGQLEDRLRLLNDGPRDLPPRQQSLRGAMDWSYELLDGDERRLFQKLAVFAGGCTPKAAEAVCGAGWDTDTLDVLTSLASKSLLRMEETNGEVRFVVLENIREYALERLVESGEVERMRQRHAEYFLTFAEETEPELKGPRQIEHLQRLEDEHDNFRAALSWSLESREDLGVALAGALWWFWQMGGYYREGLGWLEEALRKSGGAPEARANVLAGVSWLAIEHLDPDRAVESAEEGVKICRETENAGDMAGFLQMLGYVAMMRGEYDTAMKFLDEGLESSRRAEDEWRSAMILSIITLVLDYHGHYERAMTLAKENTKRVQALGDKYLLLTYTTASGLVALRNGDYERATPFLEEGLALSRKLLDSGNVAISLANLAETYVHQGDPAQAEAMYKESIELSWKAGNRRIATGLLRDLASVIGGTKSDEIRAARLSGATEALLEASGLPGDYEKKHLFESYLEAAREVGR